MGEVGDAVRVAGPVDLVVERDVEAEGDGDDDPVEHEGGDGPAHGDPGAVASLQHGGERGQHQRRGEAELEHRVLIEPLHGRHEGAVVGAGQVGHDRNRERVDQPGDEGHRHQRGAEHEPGPPVTVDAVTGRPNRLGHGGADVVVGHRSAGWVQMPVAAVRVA